MDLYVVKSTEGMIAADVTSRDDRLTSDELERLKSIDPQCILVLGASVKSDGSPSHMLEDRLTLGIDLYKEGVAPKILFSGDNGQEYYNEVKAMKDYAVERGVPEDDIFLDHAGFSTYESVYRAAEIFGVERMIVVTQSYHLYRALYGCEKMGVEALGAASDQAQYRELEAFTKFGGDMDPVTALTIDKGQKNTRLLVQPQYSPMPVEQQIAVLYCGTHGLLKDVPLNRVHDFEKALINNLEGTDVLATLKKGVINEEVTAKIEEVAAAVASALKNS